MQHLFTPTNKCLESFVSKWLEISHINNVKTQGIHQHTHDSTFVQMKYEFPNNKRKLIHNDILTSGL